MSKQYVDLRVKEGKKGKYLSGKLKGTEQIFMVFKDDAGNNTLHFKEGNKGDLIEVDKFTAKEGEYGPYELAKNANTGEVYFLAARKDARKPVTYKNGDRAGEAVMIDVWEDGAKTGEKVQLVSADFSLTIAPKKD